MNAEEDMREAFDRLTSAEQPSTAFRRETERLGREPLGTLATAGSSMSPSELHAIIDYNTKAMEWSRIARSDLGEVPDAPFKETWPDLMLCMVALQGQLFYSTQIPACLWFLSRDKSGRSPSPRVRGEGGGEGQYRDRRGEVLFIDARKMGAMVDRTHRELTDEDIGKISRTYHAWRGEKGAGKYEDVPGFCKAAMLEEINKHGYVLTPGRYVGAEAQEDDGEPFEDKMRRLTAALRHQQEEGAKLDAAIAGNLKELGYGG